MDCSEGTGGSAHDECSCRAPRRGRSEGTTMKPHSHYCQDPHCPSRWDDAVRANMPREERRPKLGDRVRPFYVGSREPIPSIHSVEALRVRTFAYVAADGLLSWLRYEERGVTWDFASEEPAKEPPHIFARRFCWCSLAAGALQRVDELRKAGAGLCPMITFDAGIAGQRGELLGSGGAARLPCTDRA